MLAITAIGSNICGLALYMHRCAPLFWLEGTGLEQLLSPFVFSWLKFLMAAPGEHVPGAVKVYVCGISKSCPLPMSEAESS